MAVTITNVYTISGAKAFEDDIIRHICNSSFEESSSYLEEYRHLIQRETLLEFLKQLYEYDNEKIEVVISKMMFIEELPKDSKDYVLLRILKFYTENLGIKLERLSTRAVIKDMRDAESLQGFLYGKDMTNVK